MMLGVLALSFSPCHGGFQRPWAAGGRVHSSPEQLWQASSGVVWPSLGVLSQICETQKWKNL